MACKSCLGSEIKEVILDKYPGLKAILEEIPDCKKTAGIELCSNQRTGGKRAPSEYNIFIGECMKSGKNMKECATAYRERGK